MKIISIDPGYERIGIAVLEKNAPPAGGGKASFAKSYGGPREELLYSDCFKTDTKSKLSQRIFCIGEEIARLIKKYKPEALAIETLFMTSNQKTVMGVSEARGVIMYEASRAGIPIFEYTPLQIKIAVTGYGRAEKREVHTMVKKLISLSDKKMIDDEVDAIAVGLTCFAHEKFR